MEKNNENNLEFTCYLVDVENVANHWINMLSKDENNKVILFYTEPSPRISYTELEGA